jgi:hypothetical protein
MLRRSALSLLLAGGLVPARAFAENAELVDLQWAAPSECPDSDAVRARIRKLAGPTHTAGNQLRAEATVTRKDEGGFHLQLVIRAGNLEGTRNIDAKSCADLAGAAAVALALLLQSSGPLDEGELTGRSAPGSAPSDAASSTGNAASSTGNAASSTGNAASSTGNAASSTGNAASSTGNGAAAPASQMPPPAAARAEPERESPRESTPDTPAARRWYGLLQIPVGAVSIGPLEQVGFGAGFAGGAMIDRWRFLAEGKLWLSQHATGGSEPEQYGADLDRFTASLRACHALLLGRIELAPCVSVLLEHLSARGTGANVAARSAGATWVAVGLGGQARLHVAPWFNVVLGIDGQLETSRPVIQIEGAGTVDQLAPVAAMVTLGSEWIL